MNQKAGCLNNPPPPPPTHTHKKKWVAQASVSPKKVLLTANYKFQKSIKSVQKFDFSKIKIVKKQVYFCNNLHSISEMKKKFKCLKYASTFKSTR